MEKTLVTAYACWLFGGLFGVHHFYMGRYKQGFIWSTTLGGFVIGWLLDVYKIPNYLKEANEDDEYMDKLDKEQSQLKIPIFMKARFIASIIISYNFGRIFRYCIFAADETSSPYCLVFQLLTPLVIAAATYIVSTEGPYKCHIKWPIIGAYAPLVFEFLNMSNIYFAPVMSVLLLNWNIEWDKKHFEKKKKKHYALKNMCLVGVGFVICASMFGLFVFNNVTYEKDGQKYKLKDSYEDFLNSEEWDRIKTNLVIAWNYYKAHGLRKLLILLTSGYDSESLSKAYTVPTLFLMRIPIYLH